jgi:hypothetical protein
MRPASHASQTAFGSPEAAASKSSSVSARPKVADAATTVQAAGDTASSLETRTWRNESDGSAPPRANSTLRYGLPALRRYTAAASSAGYPDNCRLVSSSVSRRSGRSVTAGLRNSSPIHRACSWSVSSTRQVSNTSKARRWQVAAQVRQEVQRRRIRPMHVLDDQDRAAFGDIAQGGQHRVDGPARPAATDQNTPPLTPRTEPSAASSPPYAKAPDNGAHAPRRTRNRAASMSPTTARTSAVFPIPASPRTITTADTLDSPVISPLSSASSSPRPTNSPPTPPSCAHEPPNVGRWGLEPTAPGVVRAIVPDDSGQLQAAGVTLPTPLPTFGNRSRPHFASRTVSRRGDLVRPHGPSRPRPSDILSVVILRPAALT